MPAKENAKPVLVKKHALLAQINTLNPI